MAKARLVLCLLASWGVTCGPDRPEGVTDDQRRGICADYCEALDTCDLGTSTCPLDCFDSLRATDDDDVRDCDGDLHAFRGGCDELADYIGASDACQSAFEGPGVGDADGVVVGDAAAPPSDCLSGIPCVDDTQCVAVAGTRCNTALAAPECQTVRCNAEGATCSDDSLCPQDLLCLADRCGTCESLPTGSVCVDGQAVCVDEGEDVCGSACVDLRSDPAHCGACDQTVPTRASCEDGSPRCPQGTTRCDDACVDASSDPRHCGACENDLPPGVDCRDGDASCASDAETLCDDQCVDVQYDDGNCGSCGVVCTEGYCSEGACFVHREERIDCQSICDDMDMRCLDSGQFPGADYHGWCDSAANRLRCNEEPPDSVDCGQCECAFSSMHCLCSP